MKTGQLQDVPIGKVVLAERLVDTDTVDHSLGFSFPSARRLTLRTPNAAGIISSVVPEGICI